MVLKNQPDFSLDECASCGAVFLDRSELNALATGVSGNIEYLTADSSEESDVFPKRNCPNCSTVKMQKQELLGGCGVVIDYCPKCQGFFLDKGEIEGMNQFLPRVSPNQKPEEFRGEIKGYFFRQDRLNHTVATVKGGLSGAFEIRITVFFKRPTNLGSWITTETILDKLVKLLPNSKKEDITLGIPDLDSKLLIQADDPEGTKDILKQADVAAALLNFVKPTPKIFTFPVKFEMNDVCLSCFGGPYAEKLHYDLEKDPDHIISSMISVAKAIDNRK
jgi:Zn-finger nucleic acid-binding protein